ANRLERYFESCQASSDGAQGALHRRGGPGYDRDGAARFKDHFSAVVDPDDPLAMNGRHELFGRNELVGQVGLEQPAILDQCDWLPLELALQFRVTVEKAH